jgi:hypothetical protein
VTLRTFCASWALVAAGVAVASPAPEPAPQDCKALAHRQFDFALGSFTMRTTKGVLAGMLRFEKKLDGCAIVGHWSGSQGGHGEVNLYFDRSDHRWHQLYIADDGWVLRFSGRFEGKALVMTGLNTFADGRRGLQRMTWSMLPDGSLRQFWELSPAGSRRWETLFDARGTREGVGSPER